MSSGKDSRRVTWSDDQSDCEYESANRGTHGWDFPVSCVRADETISYSDLNDVYGGILQWQQVLQKVWLMEY